MSTRAVQFDSEASRSLPRNATQQDSRCERREGREGRESNRSRGRTSEAEPTEVSVSHKKAHGKSSEKGIQSSQISKARVHSASAKSGENSLQTLEYAPSTQYTSSGNTQDHSSKASSSLYASMHTTELGRTKFMGNIPGIPAASEQSSQRGDFAGCTLFPPPSVCKYGQNVAYPTSSSSDFKPMPQDSIDTTDLIFHKSSANRYATGARNKSQADTKMQWNATHENYRLREEQKNRTVPSEFHHTRTRAGRRGKDGVNIVYNEVKISGSNRANIPRRSTSASSYSESPTDSQGSSTESESLSSSDAASIKRKRRIRRKPSNKSIGSSIYGEDNTSESESQSVGELSASDNANSYRKRRTQCLREKDDMGSVVGLKEHRSTLNRLRSSSLTSVSSLEGTGIHGDHPSRNPSPQLSQKGSSIAKVKKIQIRSFTSFADCQSYMTYMYNKENLPQRRRSTEERAEPFKMEKSRSPMSRQGTESPSLSRSPFGLKAKKGSRELLSSDSECNFASDKEHTTAQGNSLMLDERVGQDQVNQESKSGACYPTETRESRLNQNPTNELHTNSWSDFVPIKVSNRTGNNEPNLSVITQVAFDEDSRCEKSDVLIQPVARNSHNRPLSVVQETDEYADITQDGDCYRNEHVEKILKKSHFRTYEARRSPPSEDRNASISSLRRLSYVKAQTNSATVPVDSPDEKDQKDMNSNYYESLSSGFSPLYSENSTSRIYRMEVSNETKRVLEEFDPKPTVTSPIAEVDLISFEDESVERKQPVKKRTKKIIRPKIPTILGGEEETERKTSKADLPNLEITRSVSEKNEVSFSTGMFDGSKRDGIIVCGSDEDCTPQATSEVEDNQAVGVPHYDCRNKNKVQADSFHDNKNSESLEEIKQKFPPRRRLQKRASLPVIKTELYKDDSKALVTEDPSRLDTIKILESPSLRKAETLGDLSLNQVPHNLEDLSFSGTDGEEFVFLEDKNVESSSSVHGPIPSPSPSQISFDALSLTTSGFSEAHSDQVSTGDLNVEYDILNVDATSNGKSVDDAWRSQSDPSHGIQLENTVAELQAHRNSNSEPNLSGEKLKEESEQLAKRVNGGNQGESPHKIHVLDDDNDEDKESELSPDDGCYELDKPERCAKPVQRANSAPAPTTSSSPRTQRIANSFAVEKAQVKLNKLAAMETIVEMPNSEPSLQVSEKVKLENKRSSSLEGSCKSPTSGMAQDDKRKSSLPKDSGKTQKSKHDLRAHVVKNLLDTEVSYVQNLQFLVSSYYKALKKQDNAGIVEPAQVDEMFYQIPEILLCHEFFLKQLQARVNEWHDKQKIGDIFVSSFTKCFLVDAYSAFINHFLQARAAVRVATMSRPAFVRYMEQCSRDHKEKLTLQDLMIMPVQRIPRYELILKDMIKHTPHDHPDHGSLQLALGEIKTLADRMNRGEKEVDQAEREAERLRDLETTIEGMTELVTPTRRLIRQDLVAEVKGTITKKDRCLFLFNDMLACATVKRRANALRRFSSGSGTEFQKYKLLWRLHLDYVEVYKSSPEAQRRNSLEKQLEKLDTDMSSLSKISALADNLTITHMALDAAIQELMNEVNRQISEKQIPLQPPTSTKLELHAQTEEGEELFQFLFLETEIKNSWEAYFEDAKQKLAYAKDTFPPEFQNCIPINKTRSGMQFTCASPCQVPHVLDRGNHCGSGDVWVCNSDGYVGQVCILRMGSQIQPCGSITVCMSRILCISPVPGTKFIGMEALQSESETKSDTQSISLSSEKSGKTNTNRQVSHSGFASDEDVAGPQNIMAFDSSSEDEEGLGADSFLGGKFTDGNSPLFDVDGRLSPEGSSLGTTGSADGLDSSADENVFDFEENDSSCDEMKGKGSRKHSKRRIATSRSQSKDSLDPENFETDEPCTVWLGTEDGCIFLYPANETQNKKSKLKIQLSGSIQCILYVDNQVFISLSTGHLYIYRRQPGCAWEVGNPVMLHIGDSSAVSCMTAIHGRLWCGLGCNAVIVNTTTLAVETSFNCSLDKDRSVYRMASSGMGVWISLQSSAAVRLFHATRYECLADVDVAPPVHKMLASSDAIIRQHKAACLRVTALLACKDLLWIGTSAGVVLTLPLPTITASTASLRNCPSATASFHGHTGHVRFLTAVEVPKEGTHDNAIEKGSGTSPSSPTAPLQSGGNSNRDVLIISGGDGYEDFRASSASESAGRDDSTNHLLIWRV